MGIRHDLGAVVAVGALVAGLLVGERPGALGGAALLGAGTVALALTVVLAGAARVAVAALALFVLGSVSMQRALDGLDHHALAPAVEAEEPVTLRGTLTSDPDGAPFATHVEVRVDGADRTVVARATGDGAARLRALEAGDRVTLSGRLAPLPPTGWAAQARWQHAVATVERAEVVAFGAPRDPLLVAADRVRAVVVRGTEPLPPSARALTTGFLLGDTRGIPDDVERAYRDAGLSHLLAVSGSNVAFAFAIVGPLLRRLPLGGRTAASLAVVAVFAAMTRFEPSVLRASALAIVTVGAAFAGRPVAGVRALVLAVGALLLVDPFLLHSVGFALSVGASAGIVVLARPIAGRIPGPRIVREPLSVSVAAQVGVTPVLLAVFGEVPVLSPATNLLAVPAADLLGVYGMVASLAGGVWRPFGVVAQPLTALLAGWITVVARAGAAVGATLDARGVAGAGALVGVATLARRAVRAVPDPAPR